VNSNAIILVSGNLIPDLRGYRTIYYTNIRR